MAMKGLKYEQFGAFSRILYELHVTLPYKTTVLVQFVLFVENGAGLTTVLFCFF